MKCVIWAFLCLAMSLARAAEEAARIKVEHVVAAEQIIGIGFEAKEREMMLEALDEHRKNYEALRHFQLLNSIPPALVFDPVPTGMKFETRKLPIRWSRTVRLKTPLSDEDLAFATVGELGALLRARQVTSERLTKLALDRLAKYGPPLQCVVTLMGETALAEARKADVDLRGGRDRGPLHGIPYGAKDLLSTKDVPTTWGAAPFTNRVFEADATVIRKLQAAGAILVAKLTLGELAMGDTWFGGKTRNPWNPKEGSSGSSAGSAAAVAAGLVPFAIGSETVGSIVSPATVCGVTGLRPTFGRVSRNGAMALAWSSDKIGPMARSAEDCAMVFNAIHGTDGVDPTVRDLPFNFDAGRQLKDIRIGYLEKDFENARLNKTNNAATIQLLQVLGATLVPVELPDFPVGDMMFIIDVEAAAAFDALTRSGADRLLAQQGPGNWPNIFRAARMIPAVEYLQANRVRHQLIEAMAKLMEQVDVFVAPAWDGESLRLTNLTGHPAVVVPNGDKKGGAPASITFIGKLYGEADALAVARAYQAATPFHLQRPDLSGLGSTPP